MSKKIPSKKVPNYSVVLKVSGTEYKAKGKTMPEALSQISPTKMIGKGWVTVAKAGKEYTFVFNPVMLRRLLVLPFAQQVFQKRADLFLR